MSSMDEIPAIIELRRALVKGDRERARELVAGLLQRGMSPTTLLEDGVICAAEGLASDFVRSMCYIPSILIAARSFRDVLETLRPRLAKHQRERFGTVVLGMAGDDMHVLGKEIVARMLESVGFRVVDLGTEATAEQFIASALDVLAKEGTRRVVIGVSCFLTTCIAHVGELVEELNASDIRNQVRTIVGGKAMTPDWANSIGADAYGENGLEAIFQVRRLLGHLSCLYQDYAPPAQLVHAVEIISIEIIDYLHKHPKALYEIQPRQFEALIAEILASYGWKVHLTPATKDGGYDIFAISKDISGLQNSWIIECKKYASERGVGVDIVRSLYGLRCELQVGAALLATTSYFSRDAKAYKTSRYDLHLRDYQGILEWINQYRPNPKGKLYIKDNKLILPNEH